MTRRRTHRRGRDGAVSRTPSLVATAATYDAAARSRRNAGTASPLVRPPAAVTRSSSLSLSRADVEMSDSSTRWRYGLYAVGGGFVAVVLCLLIVVFKYDSPGDAAV